MLRHARVDLALYELRAGTGRLLLLLHGLGESSPEKVPASVEAWNGPVHAVDFTGHGRSSMTVGGGYTPEVLMADVSTALDHLGTATLLGGASVGTWRCWRRERGPQTWAARSSVTARGCSVQGRCPAAR